MNIVIIDNYDSFTYNLVHMLEDITGKRPMVLRNDEFPIEALERYDMILLSPGPGIPSEAGKLKQVIQTYAGKKHILGVCLGLQAVTEVFGGSLENLETVFHGVSTAMEVIVKDAILFHNIPKKFKAARYHSWVASSINFPKNLEITAIDSKGNIMALAHKEYQISAVQFHPESILTPFGEQIIRNFIMSVNL